MLIKRAAYVCAAASALLVSVTASQAATLNFPFPSGNGGAPGSCSYTSDGCFALPGHFNIFIEDTGAGESVTREFEFTYAAGGSAIYQLTINPTGSFSGTFTFGEVNPVPLPGAVDLVLAGSAVVLGSGPLQLTFNAGVLYGLTVAGTFAGGGGNYDISLTAVPIPPALLLFGSALVGLGYLARRRRASTGPSLAT